MTIAAELGRIARQLNTPDPDILRQERDALIMEAFAMGYSGLSIAAMAEISIPRVYQIRDEMRDPMRPPRKSQEARRIRAVRPPREFSVFTSQQRSTLRAAFRNGESIPSLARKYGVTEHYIRKAIRYA